MNIFKHIKFKWVTIVALIVFYVVYTQAAADKRVHTSTLWDDISRPTEDSILQDEVTVQIESDNILPKNFSNTSPNVITRTEKLNYVFELINKGDRPLRVLQLGDSHVAGKAFPNSIKKELEEAWGTSTDTTDAGDYIGKGIIYEYIAKNGATVHQFANNERMNQVAQKKPDLIILSFGTNECHSMKYNEEEHRLNLEDMLNMLNETCPGATILLTTPPGDYLSVRKVRYLQQKRRKGRRRRSRRITYSVARINPMTERSANVIEAFGAKHGLPVWNLNAIAGGKDAAINWNNSGLMRPDKVHFQPEGYTLQGKLFAAALINSYNNYCKRIKDNRH